MADDLKSMKVAILATDGVERIDLRLAGAFCPAIVAQFAKASVPGWAPGGMR